MIPEKPTTSGPRVDKTPSKFEVIAINTLFIGTGLLSVLMIGAVLGRYL